MIHFHKDELISSQIGDGTHTDSLTGQQTDGIPMTAILYQCQKCGRLRTHIIQGTWEITKLNKLAKAVNHEEM